jgi:hypothetical protein
MPTARHCNCIRVLTFAAKNTKTLVPLPVLSATSVLVFQYMPNGPLPDPNAGSSTQAPAGDLHAERRARGKLKVGVDIPTPQEILLLIAGEMSTSRLARLHVRQRGVIAATESAARRNTRIIISLRY